jgi:alkanesulfonate monooxygenase SsuD/methylene tetrahydromethanopterin reductase-like flavin-dependent oxidoreductase (luciferase family)
MGPLYRQRLVQLGFAKEVEAVLAANTPKSRGIVPADAEALLEELTVFGTPEEARAQLARWYAAGAEFPSLLFPPHLAPAELEFMLEAFRPMLAAGAAGA